MVIRVCKHDSELVRSYAEKSYENAIAMHACGDVNSSQQSKFACSSKAKRMYAQSGVSESDCTMRVLGHNSLVVARMQLKPMKGTAFV